MYINSFLSELNKKIETVEQQLNVFKKNITKIDDIKNFITIKTLKTIEELEGKDLALLTKDEFANILNVFEFNDIEDKLERFEKIKIKVNRLEESLDNDKIVKDIEIQNDITWLDRQAQYIKEFVKDFNSSNEDYYNSLKKSDLLYKKYIKYFKNDELIKPIYNIDEFDEVIKKCGLISSEKWQLMKYIGVRNMELEKKQNNEERPEYSDEEILSFVENVLSRESKLIKSINEKSLNEALDILDYDEDKLNSMNLNSKSLVRYQKIPIVDALNKLYNETKTMLNDEQDEDAKKIENNFKDMLELVESYDVIKKIES